MIEDGSSITANESTIPWNAVYDADPKHPRKRSCKLATQSVGGRSGVSGKT